MSAILLDGVTSTGGGSAATPADIIAGLGSRTATPVRFSVVVVYATAAPTAATVKLQGSIDETSWVDLGNTTDVSATVVGFSVANKPFPFVRGNLTAYTAGSCTGVTFKCVGCV